MVTCAPAGPAEFTVILACPSGLTQVAPAGFM